VFGPHRAYSGDRCWGTDLDDTYDNNADCWLESPWIDLHRLSSASLSFSLWNGVEDQTQGLVFDPLWVELTQNGISTIPICHHMGGVNDDPEIPDVGGWTRIVLDLTLFWESDVRIRFRFASNEEDTQPGSYIDDVHVYGTPNPSASSVECKAHPKNKTAILYPNYPNPFNGSTTIRFSLPEPGRVSLKIYDLLGNEIDSIVEGYKSAGVHFIQWNGDGQASGAYVLKIISGLSVDTRKLVLLK
jgi:hypothetical protein